MRDVVRQKLSELVTRFGNRIGEDPRRCESLLRDVCGEDYNREVFVLMCAVNDGVARELSAGLNGDPKELLIERLSSRLHSHIGLAEHFARWSVESWALAFGIIQGSEGGPGFQAASETGSDSGPRWTIIVSPDGSADCRGIAEAIRRVPSGGRVLVRRGKYRERLVLDKAVSIVGDDAIHNVVVEAVGASCISMETDTASVTGMTLRTDSRSDRHGLPAVVVGRGRLVLEDCAIRSKSGTGVAIHGVLADPLIRRCRIHDSRWGVDASEGGRGTLEDCDIFGNIHANVTIATDAAPTLRRCTIRDGEGGGVYAYEGGKGTLEDCDVFGHGSYNIGIGIGAAPTLRRCAIHGGKQGGVLVNEDGRGTLEDCDIFGNTLANVRISEDAFATLRRCKIHDGRTDGVCADKGGKGTLEDCDIFGNTEAGVTIATNADPTLRRCRIHWNAGSGVLAYADGRGTVEHCDLRGNKDGAWSIATGCQVQGAANKS